MKRVWIFCDGSTGAVEAKNEADGSASHSAMPGTTGHAVRNARNYGARCPQSAMSCGAGAVARAEDGRIVGWEWQALPALTNNEAEYAGLLLGIALARRLGAAETVFVLDSEIVAGQMAGRFAVHSATLRRWHWQACEALRGLPAVRFCVVPREWNRLADGLACQAGIAWEWLKEQMADGK